MITHRTRGMVAVECDLREQLGRISGLLSPNNPPHPIQEVLRGKARALTIALQAVEAAIQADVEAYP